MEVSLAVPAATDETYCCDQGFFKITQCKMLFNALIKLTTKASRMNNVLQRFQHMNDGLAKVRASRVSNYSLLP